VCDDPFSRDFGVTARREALSVDQTTGTRDFSKLSTWNAIRPKLTQVNIWGRQRAEDITNHPDRAKRPPNKFNTVLMFQHLCYGKEAEACHTVFARSARTGSGDTIHFVGAYNCQSSEHKVTKRGKRGRRL
jgi:hypothetical protein